MYKIVRTNADNTKAVIYSEWSFVQVQNHMQVLLDLYQSGVHPVANVKRSGFDVVIMGKSVSYLLSK